MLCAVLAGCGGPWSISRQPHTDGLPPVAPPPDAPGAAPPPPPLQPPRAPASWTQWRRPCSPRPPRCGSGGGRCGVHVRVQRQGPECTKCTCAVRAVRKAAQAAQRADKGQPTGNAACSIVRDRTPQRCEATGPLHVPHKCPWCCPLVPYTRAQGRCLVGSQRDAVLCVPGPSSVAPLAFVCKSAASRMASTYATDRQLLTSQRAFWLHAGSP